MASIPAFRGALGASGKALVAATTDATTTKARPGSSFANWFSMTASRKIQLQMRRRFYDCFESTCGV